MRGLGNVAEAQAVTRRATSIYRSRAVQAGADVLSSSLRERRGSQNLFFLHVHNTLSLVSKDSLQRDILQKEAFEVAQFASETTTASAVARMAARFATGDDALAVLVRERQDSADKLRRFDKELIAALAKSKRSRSIEDKLRTKLMQLETNVL
jgi:hypothetical protein